MAVAFGFETYWGSYYSQILFYIARIVVRITTAALNVILSDCFRVDETRS